MKARELISAVLSALTLTLLATAPAFASDKTDVMMPIQQFADGLNKGDVKSALAACAEQTSILDEFAPFEWHGPGGCNTWLNDFGADNKKNGITDVNAKLGKPRHVDIDGDRAYVVIPTSLTFKMKGKPMKETGSMLTVALQKGAAGWKMTGWTWTKGK